MSILDKSNEELFDFSDVDEETEEELENEEYNENYFKAVDGFMKRYHSEILNWFSKNHPKINPLLVMREWIDSGLLHTGWDPEDLFELTCDNINTHYTPSDEQ